VWLSLILKIYSTWTCSLIMYTVASALPNASYKRNIEFPNQIFPIKLVDLEFLSVYIMHF
jgi:hypothetical protein